MYKGFVEDTLKLNPSTCTLNQVNSALRETSFDGEVVEGFNLYTLVNSLADAQAQTGGKKKSWRPVENPDSPEVMFQCQAYDFFKQHTGKIEAKIGDNIYPVYFPIKPVCRYLSEKSKSKFMNEVERESPQHKIMGFLKASADLINEMYHVEMLSRAWIVLTPARLSFVNLLSTLITYTINFFILYFYKYDEVTEGTRNAIAPRIDPAINMRITLLSYVLLGLGCLEFIGWMITKAALITKSQWRQLITETQAREKSPEDVEEGRSKLSYTILRPARDLPLHEARRILRLQGPEAL